MNGWISLKQSLAFLALSSVFVSGVQAQDAEFSYFKCEWEADGVEEETYYRVREQNWEVYSPDRYAWSDQCVKYAEYYEVECEINQGYLSFHRDMLTAGGDEPGITLNQGGFWVIDRVKGVININLHSYRAAWPDKNFTGSCASGRPPAPPETKF